VRNSNGKGASSGLRLKIESLRFAALSLTAAAPLLGVVACGAVVVQSDGAGGAAAQSTPVSAPTATVSVLQQCTAGLHCAP
jgi:hypothetical protein